MSDENYNLQLSLSGLHDTAEAERNFMLGVEFGTIYERMTAGQEAEIEQATHVANRLAFERVAAAEGWTIEFQPHCDTWDMTKFVKAGPAKNNPHGIRVVN